MRTNRFNLGLVAILGAAFLFGYNNCSPVEFGMDLESLKAKLDSGRGLIVINNNEPFTNSQDVQLILGHDSAGEMYITNAPDCSSGGDWEPYAVQKAWKLTSENSSARVYAKFRETSTTDVESECLSDDIVHDNIPPQITAKPVADFINVKDTTIEFVASDSGSGVAGTDCADDGAGSGVSCVNRHPRSNLSEGPHSVRISARDLAGNSAVPVDVSFVVDLTPPTIMINSKPPKITADVLADFSFSGADALSGIAGYECRIDAGPFSSCSSPFNSTLAEGNHTFAVRAIDRAGNRSIEETYDWKIDQSAPTVRLTKTPDAFTNQAQAAFEFTGSDGTDPLKRFECKVDNGAYASCSSPHATAQLGAGSHTFLVRGYDDADNASEPASYTWLIDLTKPTVTINTRPDAVTSNTTAQYTFTSRDNESGIASTECSFDGAAFQVCDNAKNYPNLADGNHTFAVRTTDRAGNVSDVVSHSFRVDTVKPTIEIVSGPALQTADQRAEFVLRATDPSGEIARIECKIDAQSAFSACTSPKVYEALIEGSHIFSARAVDKANNVSDVKTYSWLIDRSPPAINIGKAPLATIPDTERAQVQFTVTDSGAGVDKVLCGLNDNLIPCSENEDRDLGLLQSGSYKFSIVATDKLGNEVRKDVVWTVETSAIQKAQDIKVTANNKVDVLVVIDNSGSMATEQKNMANRFATFVDQLNGLDWQVAIVTTDVSKDENLRDGRIVPLTGLSPQQFILTSSMNLATAKQVFGQTIQRAETGSGNEQGIAATNRAIDRSQDASSNAVNAPNRSLFRSGAALSVLVVTDADETNPSGTQEQNKPASLVARVKSLWPDKAFSFHSVIVKPDDAACKGINGNEGYGYAYNSLSGLTGGVVGTVCADDYGSQLAAMGKVSAELVRSATLECQPLDLNNDGKADIKITTADGSSAPGYIVEGLKVTFDRVLPIGTSRIEYSCLKPAGG